MRLLRCPSRRSDDAFAYCIGALRKRQAPALHLRHLFLKEIVMSCFCAPAVHPAIEKSRELHEQPHNFTYQELFFVRRVGEIRVRTVQTEQSAADLFGKG